MAHDHLLGVLLGLEERDVHLGHEQARYLYCSAKTKQRAEGHRSDGVTRAEDEQWQKRQPDDASCIVSEREVPAKEKYSA